VPQLGGWGLVASKDNGVIDGDGSGGGGKCNGAASIVTVAFED
jgi:hypothetical protein